jgi:transposase
MSEEEVRRASVLKRVKHGELAQSEAAEILDLSYRQLKRLYRRYRRVGAKGLVHGNAGKPSNRAKPAKERQRVLRLVRKHYSGGPGERFGPTLAAEHLQEDHSIEVDAETLRRWMLAEGLWTRERKRKPYRQRRERRLHFGELVQMDGSFEDWLEDRGGRGCLMHMVDDATSTSGGRFAEEETTWAAAEALRGWVEEYGIPRALYVDWKTVYHHAPTERQKQEGIVPISQFGRMCQKLGIQLIGANSPQAKGRVERGHGTHQDRLVKKMRLKGISNYEEANRYLAEHYLPQHNAKYAVAAREPADFHLAVPPGMDLDQVFCLEEERIVSRDWVVQYGSHWFQIEEKQRTRVDAGARVMVREHHDGSISIWLDRVRLRWHELPKRPRQPLPPPNRRRATTNSPAADHPWRRPFSLAQQLVQSRQV